MKLQTIEKVIAQLKESVKSWVTPSVTFIAIHTNDPFQVLISTLLSLRTKDAVTIEASKRLFSVARTPQDLRKLSAKKIERLIYPTGFYKTKAKRIIEICETLIRDYDGKVPDSIEELLKLKGVGRKTANLVVTLGFSKPGICVDTHVHRISNRLGIVKTKTPHETEFALMEVLPKKYWISYNDLLVTFGQNLCAPISPWCSKCPIKKFCPRVGIGKSR